MDTYNVQVLNADLTQVGLQASWETGPGPSETSPNIEFKAGPPGGPYALAANVPRSALQQNEHEGWVASSEDSSKLILKLHDPTLLGHSTETLSGADLYEFSGGQLRQVNVAEFAPGSTIGTCGAVMADGRAEGPIETGLDHGEEGGGSEVTVSAHAVSADGSRVFFEAVPGSNCSEPKHLYMRLDGGAAGAETLAIGAYVLAAANAQGTVLLLEKRVGEDQGLYLYHTELGTAEFLPSTGSAIGAEALRVSEDLNVVYIDLGSIVDRYDIPTHTLLPLAPLGPIQYVSPEGRYAYFGEGGITRYDSAENVIDCIICASSFNPDPKYSIRNGGGPPVLGSAWSGTEHVTGDDVPQRVYDTANGDFAFFATSSALLPQDINSDPEEKAEQEPYVEVVNGEVPSTDVYEWRRDGVAGCEQLQGCSPKRRARWNVKGIRARRRLCPRVN